MVRFISSTLLPFLLSISNNNLEAVNAFSIPSLKRPTSITFLSPQKAKSQKQTILFSSSSENEKDKVTIAQEEATKLRELASILRGEVSEFEKSKANEEQKEKEEQESIRQEKIATRERYSAEVPILKGDGMTVLERVDFPPRLGKEKSFIQAVKAPLPLGLILGEHETIPGAIRVDEIDESGNGHSVGVRVGDLLRACTACQVIMETPTWQLLAGGIGQPKTKRFMYGTDGRPFEEVMDALGSNRMDPDGGDVWLVIEREGEQ
eukprot:CAMPEP_0185731084 /NCGR_PEP_ID=MMETSP1171-20130828/11858_1 /TAXON_ID=374046 /ORGANISM="Helicotheca tamensis, Strain CCMP826" /LENGTH=263 /DNA_ID=CAMNT_0028400269 /DNA_START=49 /DNA_END=840 /DNA_ORIENTATION=+